MKVINNVNLALLVSMMIGLWATQLTAQLSCCQYPKPLRYVQAGGSVAGNGSREYPYNSLALAQADESWKTLMVLPSSVVLDGGISMRPGTNLVGLLNPVEGIVAVDQPIITNSSAVSNGGNGVVVQSGNVYIENIYFKDTFASAINYDEATDLIVKNVLITGANQGGVKAAFPAPRLGQSVYSVGGIQSTAARSGSTKLCHVVIKDNFAGQGVAESVSNGIERRFKAINCEFSGLGQLVPLVPGDLNRSCGVLLFTNGQGSRHKATVRNCNFHDYNPASVSALRHIGFAAIPTDGARASYEVDSSNASNLATVNPSVHNGFGVFITASTDPDLVDPLVQANYSLYVHDCIFENAEEAADTDSSAIYYANTNTVSRMRINSNVIRNYFDNISSYIGGDSRNNSIITHNDAQGNEAFFGTLGYSHFPTVSSSPVQQVTLTDNNFVGGDLLFGAILVIPNFVDGNNWQNLLINASNNCFSALPGDAWALVGYDFGLTGVGNATINAHNNNITGFGLDIVDEFADVNYLAQSNWWGQPSGTTLISTQPGYAGTIDVSAPLQAPIICPLVPVLSLAAGTSKGVFTARDRAAKLSAFKERALQKEN